MGRRARLEAVFEQRDGRTVLTHGYAEPPLRIGRCLEEGASMHFIAASCAPGLFGGDCLEQRVDVGPGARARLTSQAAQQIHPSTDGRVARVRSRYRVAAGGCLSCVWDPVIPFPGASLDQEVSVDVEPGGRLVWSDAMMAGREGRGERWLFNRVAQCLAIRRDAQLVYLERYVLEGRARNRAPWLAGEHCYFGTILRLGFGDRRDFAEAIHAELRSMEGVTGTADLLPDCDALLVRVAAESGVPFHRARAAVDLALTAPPE